MNDTNSMIINNLGFSYGDKKVFDGFSLELKEEGRICLMSPSGRGKTTLLRLITGLEKPSHGSITGKPRAVAMVFQEDRLCPQLSIIDNVMLTAAKGVTRSEAEELLKALGLWDNPSLLPRELSGGMGRRAALARALLAPFELLVLDEVFAGLDEENKKNTADIINRYLKAKKASLILSSHDEGEASLLNCEIIRI